MNIVVNTSDISRAREELAGWAGALDAKRPTAWNQYGYPTEVKFQQLLTAYERGGPAQGAVHRILDKCWQDLPRIKQPKADEATPWETKLTKLLKTVGAWAKLRDFDRRNMVGRYSGLIYRVADGKKLSEQLDKASKLVDLIPVYEDQLKVTAWHSDQADPDNFGKPKMFQYRAHLPGATDTQAQPDKWEDVHPSRVQILAEGSVGNMFEGVPLLKAGFNSLVDIEKISGGSAESYLKNSARTIVFKYDANASVQAITTSEDGTTKTVRQVHEEQTRALNRNQDSSIVLQGGEADVLKTATSDPGPAFEVAAYAFCASVGLSYSGVFGQRLGQLASEQDIKADNARCVGRRINELTPMLEEFVTRMQAAGIIEPGEFDIEWPPLDAPGDDAKYALLDKLTSSMQKAFQSGLSEPLFDANELRGVAGFEARVDDGMPTEGDPAKGQDTNGPP